MRSDRPKFGSEPRIHHSTSDTRERAYDRLRKEGVPRSLARKIAEQTAKVAHEAAAKKGKP